MFSNKNIFKVVLFCFIGIMCFAKGKAQIGNAYFKDAIKENRNKFDKNIIANITKTLLLPLNDTTEAQWTSAFYNISLIQYKSPTLKKAINKISKSIATSSIDCKKEFLNLINTYYSSQYFSTVKNIAENSNDNKVMAMAFHYLMRNSNSENLKNWMSNKIETALLNDSTNAILHELKYDVVNHLYKTHNPSIETFFAPNYLPKTTIVFSFQKHNRNYPGMVMIRKADGHFLKNDDSSYFYTKQLARSLSNMPGYITNGNTPQGIFKMNGFDTSKNYFIGPTANIQLIMPFETSRVKINGDDVDTTWTLEQYKDLLPANFRNYNPLYGSYYAGKAGRTEIIAHGTTVNPKYYKGKKYYPFTPTAGCLATTEWWSENNGTLLKSDQYLLAQALQKAGGAIGYLIVVEIDNNSSEYDNPNAPITFEDIKNYLP